MRGAALRGGSFASTANELTIRVMSGYSLEGFEPAAGYDVDGFESAAGHSIIAHRKRGPKGRNPKLCHGANFTCNGYGSKGTNYCAGHLRSMGIIK